MYFIENSLLDPSSSKTDSNVAVCQKENDSGGTATSVVELRVVQEEPAVAPVVDTPSDSDADRIDVHHHSSRGDAGSQDAPESPATPHSKQASSPPRRKSGIRQDTRQEKTARRAACAQEKGANEALPRHVRQRHRETDMLAQGRDRYREATCKAVKQGRGDQTNPGRTLLREILEAYVPVVEELQKTAIKRILDGKAVNHWLYVLLIDPKRMAYAVARPVFAYRPRAGRAEGDCLSADPYQVISRPIREVSVEVMRRIICEYRLDVDLSRGRQNRPVMGR